ncbi:hypothetical protein CesoFtcFv8_022726 [Champsocephalus esox]|uniref:Secreted protein n=1 Tax=Champsocephalus esox TaxID=159716 RepID=A0AAN8B7N7_9TELE|nr:hypothetical protein CesoFtcFv8_022726 [Champsocephalus esox]
MESRSSAYFHLLSSYFFAPAAAFVACTCGPLGDKDTRWPQEVSHKEQEVSVTEQEAGSGRGPESCAYGRGFGGVALPREEDGWSLQSGGGAYRAGVELTEWGWSLQSGGGA